MKFIKVPLGRVFMTPGVMEEVELSVITQALRRHAGGDWGELSAEDRAENDLSLEQGFRLLSAYKSPAGIRFWIITEADRSVTTVLLPDEY